MALGGMEVVCTLVKDNLGFVCIFGGRSMEGEIVIERLGLVGERDKEENDLVLMKVRFFSGFLIF